MVGKKPRQVSCGGFHTAVVTEDGKLYTTGGGEHGQVGFETRLASIICRLDISMIFPLKRFLSFALCNQLGHNDRVNRLKPTFVQALNGEFVSEITCGWSHSVALTSKGHVYTWGNSDHGKSSYFSRSVDKYLG